MDRRKALKGIGLSFGYLMATPAVLSVLQGCQQQDSGNWKPVFFTTDEAVILTGIIDMILPATEKYPGALDVHVPQFIDAFADAVYEKKAQQKVKSGMKEVVKALKSNNKNYKQLLDKHLVGKSDNKLLSDFLSDIRKMTVWAYMTSEQVGERVLAYDPVPGAFRSCIPVEEATGGLAWSIPK